MKMRVVFLSVFVALVFSSCSLFISAVDGNGEVTETERTLGSFDGINLEGIANVHLTQGSQSVRVVTDANLQDFVKLTVDDGELKIFEEENISPTELDIYISNPNYRELDLDGSGNIMCNTSLIGEELEVGIDGSGNINLSNIEYDAIEVDLDGSGNIDIAGEAEEAEIELNGSGNINLINCNTVNAEVELDGSGDVSLNVTSRIVAELNGSGDIRYKGNPKETRTVNNGSGNIVRLD